MVNCSIISSNNKRHIKYHTGLIQQQRNLKQKGGQQQNQRRGGGPNQRGGDRGDRAPIIYIWGDEILESEAENPWPPPYMSFTYHNPHDESKREAKPITFPTNQVNPPLEFIENTQFLCLCYQCPTSCL